LKIEQQPDAKDFIYILNAISAVSNVAMDGSGYEEAAVALSTRTGIPTTGSSM